MLLMKDSSASYFYTRTVRVRKHTSFSLTQSQEFDIKKVCLTVVAYMLASINCISGQQ